MKNSQVILPITILVLSFLAISSSRLSAQCPPVGDDSDCGVIITIDDSGATVTATGQPPYDGDDDTLIGVVNNSKLPITSLVLKSALNIFAFDGDGIDTYGVEGNASDPTGYGGPNAFFSSISADATTGTVDFKEEIAPNGGTDYFSLENAIDSATACTSLINNSLATQASGENVCATFTPNQGYTLKQAAELCGFKDFDWIQQIKTIFDPSPFYARNDGGAFDSKVTGPVRLTSLRVPWNDPPQGGGYAEGAGGTADPQTSYPFYYDPTTEELPDHENGVPEVNCTLPTTDGVTLSIHDAPANQCLPGGSLVGTVKCKDALLAPGAKGAPKGSFSALSTHLVGVNFDNTATDLGIGYTWTSNFNGSTGGVTIAKTNLPGDNNGTGGTNVTSVTQTSNYSGLTVTAVNNAPPGAPGPLSSGKACDGAYTGTFHGNITVAKGQNCKFTNGYITGNLQLNGGTLELGEVLIGGNVQVNGKCAGGKKHSCVGGTFTIGPSTAINGNLEVLNLPAGDAVNQICGATVHRDLQFLNNGTAVEIGATSPSSCLGNVINGNLVVQNNTGSTSIYGNKVKGNLQAQKNSSAQVFNNTVAKDLRCAHNASITGGTNTAQKKLGQCADF
jgi:hypothetical protein